MPDTGTMVSVAADRASPGVALAERGRLLARGGDPGGAHEGVGRSLVGIRGDGAQVPMRGFAIRVITE
jgi:hypothetical protein